MVCSRFWRFKAASHEQVPCSGVVLMALLGDSHTRQPQGSAMGLCSSRLMGLSKNRITAVDHHLTHCLVAIWWGQIGPSSRFRLFFGHTQICKLNYTSDCNPSQHPDYPGTMVGFIPAISHWKWPVLSFTPRRIAQRSTPWRRKWRPPGARTHQPLHRVN